MLQGDAGTVPGHGPVCGDVAQGEQEQRSPCCSLSLGQLCNFNFHLGASPSECFPKFGKCFVEHKKSYRVYRRPRALVRDGYLQADTEHCFRAEGRRTSGDGLRTDLGRALPEGSR
jgi:hypothetical protein